MIRGCGGAEPRAEPPHRAFDGAKRALPIYKASYDLCLCLEQIVRNFSRYHKYSIGADLRDGARRVLRLVVRANSRREKTSVLLELREEVEELKVLAVYSLSGAAMKYKVLLKKSEEGISASVPGLPGCWSQGADEAEALDNIRSAIVEYLSVVDERTARGDVREIEIDREPTP